MNTLQSEWDSFEKDVLHVDAPEVQRSEMKKAFYAGAWSALSVMVAVAEEDMSDDAGAHVFHGLLEECQDFMDWLLEK